MDDDTGIDETFGSAANRQNGGIRQDVLQTCHQLLANVQHVPDPSGISIGTENLLGQEPRMLTHAAVAGSACVRHVEALRRAVDRIIDVKGSTNFDQSSRFAGDLVCARIGHALALLSA